MTTETGLKTDSQSFQVEYNNIEKQFDDLIDKSRWLIIGRFVTNSYKHKYVMILHKETKKLYRVQLNFNAIEPISSQNKRYVQFKPGELAHHGYVKGDNPGTLKTIEEFLNV